MKNIKKEWLLPILPRVMKLFVVWASIKDEKSACDDESVKTSTLKSYIAGIKVWHMYHDED